MTHASPVRCSSETDDKSKLPANPKAGQAATRAAYIARVVGDAPPLTAEQVDLLAVILAPAIRQNATPIVTVADYQAWETRRHLQETEAPGRHGYFTAEDAA